MSYVYPNSESDSQSVCISFGQPDVQAYNLPDGESLDEPYSESIRRPNGSTFCWPDIESDDESLGESLGESDGEPDQRTLHEPDSDAILGSLV